MELLQGLNERQREAVTAVKGPVLIMAGAGSGKTKALTHRVAHLIRTAVARPSEIMAVTFTNKAANEMRERLFALLKINPSFGFATRGESPDLPVLGTFHSLCVRILRRDIHALGWENSFVIYDAADQLTLIRQVMQDLKINDRQFSPRAVLSQISAAKNQLIDQEEYRRLTSSVFTEQASLIYKHYQLALAKSQALDFDDLIFFTVRLFQEAPSVLAQYQERFRYLHVDEYQDTNRAQYRLINLWAEKYRNLCVVGDDWQSIYSWRGADIQNILDFQKDYPEAKVIKLEQNYRSSQTILDTAGHIISKNRNRTEKKLWTENNQGEPVEIARVEDERQEAEEIARAIERACTSFRGVKTYRDFVVLYRTNSQSRTIEEGFLRYGIPYKIVGGVKFYERKEIKDILAYLRLILNPADTVSLLRIINVPARKIGDKTINDLREFGASRGCSLFEAMRNAEECGRLSSGKGAALARFALMIDELRQLNQKASAATVIKNVLIKSGYKDFLLEDGTVEGEARLENVQELITVAGKYDQLEPVISLAAFLEEVALISDLDEMNDQEQAVTLMTLHAAKGLEFPHVFICGLEEGVFPHSRSLLEPTELEEERRLMYVGVTRAKESLSLLCARRRLLYGESRSNAPSRFLADIPAELARRRGFERSGYSDLYSGLKPVPMEGGASFSTTETVFSPLEYNGVTVAPMSGTLSRGSALLPEELRVGDKVQHKIFGRGEVLSVLGGIVTVDFQDPRVGNKKLVLAVAPLEKVSD